ncbi:MAG: hypothetical protein KGJ09_02190 [Candidatus Omnitrophica bacterium]|nr:hypothetical protein [Candidatus Omnitrophota bacterium]MDE2008868.1 hypothetical protein [Candidatus Omnitrophota bacterium]MDE2213569.1 hypothetical protein [Candidatus Omnitrophota bacterium]MDE2230530.1 hypothetical protein [Candidatus Omnitrophota bacterium]
MLKLLPLLVLTALIVFQTVPAYCAVSRTVTFQLSVTIPPHVMLNPSGSAFPNNPYQITQTQTLIRNNQTIRMTTIVVP